jgi:predicted nucleic acid-binding Zn finger protein
MTDMVEEQLVKGKLRWLANFNEIQRDYTISDLTFSIYASGSLQEKGFLLSRLFSALVTPKYKIHLLLYTTSEINPKLLRKIILFCKDKFGSDDWIFLGLVQSQPLEKTVKEVIENTADRTVGIAAFSLASKEAVISNNVLGKGLAKQLKLTEAKFEVFDVPDYVKSFTITFCICISFLIGLSLAGLPQAVHPITLLFMAIFSLITGHQIYKKRYRTTLSLNSKGFQLQEGQKITEGKWSHYSDVTMYITPRLEVCLRLHSKKETFDLPLSRVGISRKEAYNTIKQLIAKK